MARSIIAALLIFPLHATFLSDGRVSGFAALGRGIAFLIVAWWCLVIFAAAALPTRVIFNAAISLLGGSWDEYFNALYAAETGSREAGKTVMSYILLMRAISLPFVVASIVLIGPRIPHIVDGRFLDGLLTSIRHGARQFWPMTAKLAVGPGLVILAHQFVQWRIIAQPVEAYSRADDHPLTILTEVLALAVYAFCAAMTAGVLSDAYRRALASEAGPPGNSSRRVFKPF